MSIEAFVGYTKASNMHAQKNYESIENLNIALSEHNKKDFNFF